MTEKKRLWSGYKVYQRGYQTEMRLVKLLQKEGYFATRVPRSGKGLRPDVIAIRHGRILLFEVKRRKYVGVVYLRKEEVEKLLDIANIVDGDAYLAVWGWRQHYWGFKPLERYTKETKTHYVYGRRPRWMMFEEVVSPAR